MSATEEMAPDSMEQACMLCRRAEADPGICGHKLQKHGLCAHEFCLFFANGLFQKRVRYVEPMGFLPEDIWLTIEYAEWKHCFVCGESGATITCRETGCERSFHLPCAMEGGCVTKYFELYRAFCWEHRPEQAVEAAPEENTTCLICLEPVGDQKSYGTMVCPACKHAWLHRGCIQAHAIHVGYFSFCCPLCRNEHRFMMEMLNMGIRIPKSLPSWQGGQADAGLRARHSRCDASVCLCPGGREQAEEEGPWELLLCSSCAAEGTHRHCSSLSSSTASWECDSCAGLGTASSATSELASPSRAAAGPSRGSPAPGSSSPGTASQAAARLSHSSPALETGIQSASGSSRGSQAPGTSSPGTASQAASRPGHSSPARASGSCSSPPGPDRTRTRSRLQHRAQIPYSRPRRRHENRQMPAPSAGSSTQSQAGRGPSHGSPVPNTSSPSIASQLPSGSSCGSPALEGSSGSSTPGPTRVRALSRAQRRAPDPYSRPRRTRRTRSPAPAPSAESSTPSLTGLDPSHRSPAPETSSPSTASQLPSGSSCGSPALESSSHSSSPGPVRIRESSRLQRRAQNPYSRPRRRRGNSCAPSPSAGPDAPPPGQ